MFKRVIIYTSLLGLLGLTNLLTLAWTEYVLVLVQAVDNHPVCAKWNGNLHLTNHRHNEIRNLEKNSCQPEVRFVGTSWIISTRAIDLVVIFLLWRLCRSCLCSMHKKSVKLWLSHLGCLGVWTCHSLPIDPNKAHAFAWASNALFSEGNILKWSRL